MHTKDYMCTNPPFCRIGPCLNSYTEEKNRLMFNILGRILLCLMTWTFSKVWRIATVCHYTTMFYKNKI